VTWIRAGNHPAPGGGEPHGPRRAGGAPEHRPRLIGRERETEALDAAVRRCARGGHEYLEIAGDPGIGKSRLLGELAARASAAGLTVLTGRAFDGDDDRPLGLFAELAPPARAGADRAAAGDAAFEAVRRRLGESGGPGTVLCLDDVHWADGDSLRLLRRLLHRPPAGPLLLACALRPRQATAPVTACPADAAGAYRTTRLDLGPLPADALGALLDDPAPEPRHALLHQVCEGNPLYLRALRRFPDEALRALDHAEPPAGLVPPAVCAQLLRDAAGLSAEALTFAHAAAVLVPPFPPDLPAAVAGQAADAALAALDELTARDVLRPDGGRAGWFRFRHPVLRLLLRGRTPPGRRISFHRRAAAALAAVHADPCERAPHLAHCARLGDLAAVETLAEAAGRVLGAHPLVAAGWLEAALLTLPRDGREPLRRRLLTSLLTARARTGRVAEGRAVLTGPDGTFHGLPAEEWAGALAHQAANERRLGDLAGARTLLAGAVAARPSSTPLRLQLAALALAEGDRPRAAHLCHRILADPHGTAQDLPGQATTARAPHTDAGVPPAVRMAVSATAALCAVAGEDPAAAGFCAVGLDAAAEMADGELAAHLDALGRLGWAQALTGRYGEARRVFGRGVRVARESGQRFELALALLGRACTGAAAGALDEAVECAAHAGELARDFGHRGLAGCADVARGWALLWREGPDAAAVAAERAAGAPGPAGRAAVGLLGAVELSRDRAALAARPGTVLDVVAAAARVVTGVAGPACRPLGDGGPSAPWRRGQVLFSRLPAAAGPAARADLLGAAADAFAAAGLAPTACWLGLLRARALVRLGRPEEGAAQAGAAKPAAAHTGATHLLRVGIDVQRAAGSRRGRTAAPDRSMSAREREIAALVCQGLSNREVAQALYISAKTVEAHLTRIFRKSGVTSRSALVAALTPRTAGAA
jgi:DNA-binding CsgD family transcriptional regulator/tetratricopeptide (TPR) repeat protein